MKILLNNYFKPEIIRKITCKTFLKLKLESYVSFSKISWCFHNSQLVAHSLIRGDVSHMTPSRKWISFSVCPPLSMNYVPKIFITRPDIPESALKLLKNYDLDIWDQEKFVPRDVFLKRIAGKHALFINSKDIIDAEALDAAGEKLKVIATISVGYDHINVEEVKSRGIKLGYTARVLDDAVAEIAMGLLLATTRRLFEAHNQISAGNWTEWTPWTWMNGLGLKCSVIGIFGLGRIGMEIARRLVPFKPHQILYASRTVKKEGEEVKAVKVSLDELFKKSDVIIVTCSLNEETKGIIDKEKIGLMKNTAFIINVSRGGVINEEALIEALKERKIGGAGLDVMATEPLPKDHELLKLDNCCTTPHIGSAQIFTRIQMAELTANNIIAGLNGMPLPMEIQI